MTTSFRALAAVAALGVPLMTGTAFADDLGGGKHAGDIMVRLRGIVVAPEDNSSSISAIGGKVSASTTAVPEVDVSYFFTPNIAVEVIAATTQHRVTGKNTALGDVDVGTVWVLPPTVTAQYHPFPDARFSPYVGAGVNYTFFYSAHAPGSPVSSASYENNWGAALQIGVDYHVTGNWYANVDVKQLFVSTKAKLNGGAITAKTALDPLIIGFGVGYKF